MFKLMTSMRDEVLQACAPRDVLLPELLSGRIRGPKPRKPWPGYAHDHTERDRCRAPPWTGWLGSAIPAPTAPIWLRAKGGAERKSFAQVYLDGRLRDAARRINPEVDGELVDEAIKRLERAESQSLVDENARARLLTEGVPVEYRADDGSVHHQRVAA